MNNTLRNNTNLPPDFFDELKKLLAEMLSLTKEKPGTELLKSAEVNKPAQFEETVSLTRLMQRNFESMLSSTGAMMKNMGSIEGGITVLLKTVLQVISSLTSGSGGGIFGSIFGSLLGLIGGPIGSAIGGVLGSGFNLSGLFGNSPISGSSPVSGNFRQIPMNSLSGRNPNIINQVIIKNPVTFTKAYDVEVRSRLARGGIDL